MASGGEGDGSLPHNFLLTPHQQNLLFAALNVNKQQPQSMGLATASGSSLQGVDGAGFQESPYLDNQDYDFGDSSFDFSFADNGGDLAGNMIGDIPATAQSDSTDENENHEKRSHPDDEDDDSSPGNDSKRRESSEKVAKKPGRKPLTSEPTSKRKAQNRAAQRAFRERKEKHLKDLETKVEELEKASDAANNENSKLRAQLDRITMELNQYKQRLATVSNTKSIPREKVPFGNAAVNNLNDVNFHFEFPKFGTLPGPPMKHNQSVSQPISPQQNGLGNSPARALSGSSNSSKSPQSMQQRGSQDKQFKDELSRFTGVFSPPMGNLTPGSHASFDSVPFSVAAATSSPSASSASNIGPSSSCGTSPEPSTQSPISYNKPLEMLTTIGEEQPATATAEQPFAHFTNVNIGSPSFDWLVQQNGGGQFDPQLFGGYREPQESILSNPMFDDFFNNDSLDADFFTPFNTAPQNEHTSKKTLINEIDAQQDAIVNDTAKKPCMNSSEIWEKLQDCPDAQSGDFDLDGLCSELTKKAKCSGSGPVVAEKDFDTILHKYMGKEVSKACMADKLGIAVHAEKPNGMAGP